MCTNEIEEVNFTYLSRNSVFKTRLNLSETKKLLKTFLYITRVRIHSVRTSILRVIIIFHMNCSNLMYGT